MKKKKKRTQMILLIILLLIVAGAGFYFFNNFAGKSTNCLQVYFIKGDEPYPVRRDLDPQIGRVQQTADQLMRGPTKEEREKGIFTGMPRRARILDIKKEGSTVLVNFNQALEDYGDGAANVQALVSQIVYTFTDVPGVEKVKITVEGRDEVILGGEGLLIDQELSRNDL